MAENSLDHFFAAYHRCNDWNLQKAVMRCATGPCHEALARAACTWTPAGQRVYFYLLLKRIMIAAGEDQSSTNKAAPMPPPLKRTQITPAVTRVRKELEAWLRRYWPDPSARTHDRDWRKKCYTAKHRKNPSILSACRRAQGRRRSESL